MRVKPARYSREKCAEHKGGHFVTRGVNANGLGRDFVVAYRQKTAAVSGINQADDDVNRHRRDRERPK